MHIRTRIAIRARIVHCSWSALLAVVTIILSSEPAPGQGVTATGVSSATNPAISVNALIMGAYASELTAETTSGLRVQELELQFTSFVDPYWKAVFILALPDGENVELEEGYVTSLGLPGGLQLRTGKFYAALGRQNLLHTHAFAFLDAPLVNEQLLGDEGLNEAGVSLHWLTPLPWFVEVTGQILDGANEHFASEHGGDLLYLGHLKSFHELGDATTVEWGGSAAAGSNALGGTSSLLGADLTVKWRPLGAGTRRAFVWQTEYLRADDDSPGVPAEGGLYTQAQVRFARRWWAEGRFDWLGLPKAEPERDWRASALLALVPSEFSTLRLQYSRLRTDGDNVDQLMLQLNVTIGSHPAHRY